MSGFHAPIALDTEKPLGRVALTALPDQSVIATWLGRSAQGITLRARQAWPDGSLSKSFDVAAAPANHRFGFPFAVSSPEGVVIVWTESDTEEFRGIHSVLLTEAHQ